MSLFTCTYMYYRYRDILAIYRVKEERRVKALFKHKLPVLLSLIELKEVNERRVTGPDMRRSGAE